MAQPFDISDFDHVHMLPLAVGAAAIGFTPAWCRALHKKGLLQLERPGGPRGKFYIRMDELERAANAGVLPLRLRSR